LRCLSWLLLAAGLVPAAIPVVYRDGAFIVRDAHFTVALDQPGAPPLDGTYSLVNGENRFVPRYPPQPGAAYRVTVADESVVIRVPERVARAAAEVSQVYPTAPVLPENLLKFYLQFSAPMSRGEAVRRVHLLKANGEEVSAPFLEIDEELWDRDARRLTLLFDPGRIKRGLLPREEVGAALVPGQKYTLVIDAAWPDADGQPLAREFRKEFTVGEADRTPVNPKSWHITRPKGQQPLTIDFGEPVDSALAPRLIRVLGVDADVTLEAHESRLVFITEKAWVPGTYTLEVNPALEDVAGNRVNRPFDVDRFDRVSKMNEREPATRITFTVQ
jgi:hypothetical protein